MNTRQGKLAILAVLAVALTAAGAALAVTRLHGSTPSARASAGPVALASYGGTTTRPFGFGFRHGRDGMDILATAATYLGKSESDLQSALASGKTLAQIADATSGKSASGLVDALVSAQQARIQQAVKDGHLTQSQADEITARLKDRITQLVNGTFPQHRHLPFGGHGPGDDLQAAATYLGISTTDLLTQLRSGKTLAQVADGTSGKSAGGLVDALVAHESSELDQSVKDGRLTRSQADQIEAGLKTRITALVDGTAPAPRFHFGDGDHGFGPPPWGGGNGAPGSAPPTTSPAPAAHI